MWSSAMSSCTAGRKPKRCSMDWKSCRRCGSNIAASRSPNSISTRACARAPKVVAVDELAHTNHPGARHAKRWMDVEELLDAGIDVYATVNVQHIESLNDVVAQITGVQVRETVPDKVFDSADEVELIDLPPDELLERLREGKVYVEEKVRARAQFFFPQGQSHRAASARVARDGRSRRRGDARISSQPRHSRNMGGRRTHSGLRRTRSVVRTARARGAAHGQRAARGMDGCLCRNAASRAPFARGARSRAADAQARRIARRADRKPERRKRCRRTDRFRASAQHQQDRGRQAEPSALARSAASVAGRRNRAQQRRHRCLRDQRRTRRADGASAARAATIERMARVCEGGRRRRAGHGVVRRRVQHDRADQSGHDLSARHRVRRRKIRARTVDSRVDPVA